ncbi:MAG TPA: hypothetical protein VK955_06525, partial [Xanthobacteraceae bacterium]|nr:hypothetical protein [Xanthobacteraceae bacterium]
ALLPAAAMLAAVAVLGGAGGIYWILAQTPAPAPATASTPMVASAVPVAPSVLPAAANAPSQTPPQPPTQLATTAVPREIVRVNEAKVRALAADLKIPLPQTIRVVEPSSDVSKKLVDYLGAWGGDRRWGSRGRQMILLVTHVDSAGNATGIVSFGPPTPTTYNQNPANYWTFTGTIAEEELKFLSPDGKWTYRFRIMPDGIMQGRLVNPDNHPSNISVERLN